MLRWNSAIHYQIFALPPNNIPDILITHPRHFSLDTPPLPLFVLFVVVEEEEDDVLVLYYKLGGYSGNVDGIIIRKDKSTSSFSYRRLMAFICICTWILKYSSMLNEYVFTLPLLLIRFTWPRSVWSGLCYNTLIKLSWISNGAICRYTN